MRVALFTDTLGDVNGVSRFIQNIAATALRSGRSLDVLTSTRFQTPALANIHNFAPVCSAPMPGYRTLDVCIPPALRMLRHARALSPDAIHVSTPGPVGFLGVLAARRLGAPLLGVYHTDFPAYVEQLLDDAALTWVCRKYERWFYSRFRAIFTRSRDYSERLEQSGLGSTKMFTLAAGIDIEAFHPRFRDPRVWSDFGHGEPGCIRALYVGRVSVEKGLHFLANAWRRASSRLRKAGVPAELVVVGDGPYRPEMERECTGTGVRFLGFRHGIDLSRIYASSDFFVFPSTTDTLGQVVMEAQASGLPVVVTNMGGPKELVREGETGLVLPSDDPDRWVDELVFLASNRSRCAAMGARARVHLADMSIERSFEHFWTAHAEIVRAHTGRRGTRTGPAAPIDPSHDRPNIPPE